MPTGSTLDKGTVVLRALFSGFILGITARAWMRWISTDPEFTWSGTIFIVMAFMIFMTSQSIVMLLRQRYRARRSVLIARAGGVIFSLPLFSAAGLMMFPTVALASVGVWNPTLGRRTRGVLILLSLIAPIKISIDLISDFGWTIATLGRIVLFLSIYLVVIIATRPTMTPFRGKNYEAVKMSKMILAAGILATGAIFLLSTMGITRN